MKAGASALCVKGEYRMDETLLMKKIDAFVAENKENILRDLASLVAVNSVEGTPEPGAPFGAGPKKALETALSIASGMGLATRDCDGYIGYAEIPGESEKQIATITHLDVVPQGNGWTGDPFTLRRREGYLIGRGVGDDKGPAVLTLYAAKFFREQGEKLPYTLRILLGANEETGMADVDYYLEHNPQPVFCFTPDAEFPVCYGEKGGFGGNIISAPLSGKIVSFEGGVARNVVPNHACARVLADAAALADTENVKVTDEGNGIARIEGFGKGGHAASPAGTVNAIALVVNYLLDNRLCSDEEEKTLAMLRTFFASTDGSSIDIAACDDLFDPLTCSGGVIGLKDGRLYQSFDIRFPTSTSPEILEKGLTALAESVGGTLDVESFRLPFYVDPNAPVIRTLIQTYNDVTGENAKPFTMGGGTYARHFTSAVSFGMEKPGEKKPAWIGSAHGADEGVREGLLWEALKIYIIAIARLMKLDF